MQQTLQLLLSNFPLAMLILSIVIALSKRHGFFRRLLFCTLFFAAGLSGIWGFIMHAFFPQITSQDIGYARSPFEYEVAIANLSFGIASIIAAFSSYSYRKAAITVVCIFLWGAAIGHIYEFQTANNYHHGNIGSILWTDILIPTILWISLLYTRGRDQSDNYLV